MASTADAAIRAVRIATIPYLSASAQHSLYKNGKVLTRRDEDGTDVPWVGADLVARSMPVIDARELAATEQPSLEVHGFEFHTGRVTDAKLDFIDHEEVVCGYYPECAALVRVATGARVVAAFDHNVRSVAGKNSKRRIEGGQQVQGPARVVHGDYTLTSAPQRLRDLTRPPGANDTLRTALVEGEALLDEAEVETVLAGGRYAIINVWRNIAEEPVATHPLGLCDATSVAPEDLVVFEIHYSDRIGENYFSKYAERHKWYFWSALTRDEAVLIKQWDSAGELARTNGANGDAAKTGLPSTFSFHTAFEDPATPPDAPDRWSIEVRCVAIYD